MKNFKQFLMETQSSANTILADIEKYRSLASDGLYLIRGVRGRTSSALSNHVHTIDLGREGLSGGPLSVRVFKAEPRAGRRPLNTDEDVHHWMDDWFEAKYGFNARSESVFCFKQEATADFSGLRTYGIPTIIAPASDFDYLWSSAYEDLFFDITGTTEKAVISELEAGKFQFNTGWDSIKPHHEVMINCDAYYVFVLFDGSRAAMPADDEEVLLQDAVNKFLRGE